MNLLELLKLQSAEHAIFAPSSSHRWMLCAGSLIATLIAGDEAGFEAAEGTVAHYVADVWFHRGYRPLTLVGTVVEQDGFPIQITREMLDAVEQYVNWCIALEGDHESETRVDISELFPIPNQFGTCDYTVSAPRVLTVTDFKYGIVRVLAKRNPQLMLYALGKYFELNWLYSFERIVLRIAQPRIGHFDTWEISRDELLMFAGEVRSAAKRAWRINAPRTPSKAACEYCPVQATCAARGVWLERMSAERFDDLDAEVTSDEAKSFRDDLELGLESISPPDVFLLTNKELGRILPYALMIDKFFKSAKALAEKAVIELGEHVPGWKKVYGKASREFTVGELEVISTVSKYGIDSEELYTTEFASVAQVENLLKLKGFKTKDREMIMSSLSQKGQGRLTIAPDTDRRREAVDSGAAFDDLEVPDDVDL